MQKNKCCTFITFLKKLPFCNSKNEKKSTKKNVALKSEFIFEYTFFIIEVQQLHFYMTNENS